MATKVMITAKLPKSVHQKMLEKIIKDGYGMRGKSLWMHEAIERFLQLENYPEFVDIATEMDEMIAVVTARISRELIGKLDEAVIVVRREYLGMEGVKSSLIRASIIQRLIRG